MEKHVTIGIFIHNSSYKQVNQPLTRYFLSTYNKQHPIHNCPKIASH